MRQHLRQRTAIEAVQPVFCQPLKGGCHRRLIKAAPDLWQLTVYQPGFRKTGDLFQLVEFTRRGVNLRGRDRRAVLRILNGVGQQADQRQRFTGHFT